MYKILIEELYNTYNNVQMSYRGVIEELYKNYRGAVGKL